MNDTMMQWGDLVYQFQKQWIGAEEYSLPYVRDISPMPIDLVITPRLLRCCDGNTAIK